MASDYNQLSEDLFQAMSIIAAEQLKGLQFNQTLKCSITDISNADKGEYTVTDGSSIFTAYSENNSYRVGNYVYVLVPNGDLTQQKTILGKYVSSNSEYYTYTKPSDTFVNITGNISEQGRFFIYESEDGSKNEVDKTPLSYGIVANGIDLVDNSEPGPTVKNIWEIKDVEIGSYDRLCITAGFKTLLSNYNLCSGNYGLRIILQCENKTTTQTNDLKKYYSFEFDSNDMYGDPYNFETFYTQECVIDIGEITKKENIVSILVSLYEKGNFVNDKNQRIPAIINRNILLDDNDSPLNIAFGYDLSQFTDDKVFLYSFDSHYYATYLTDDLKEKYGVKNESLERINKVLSDLNRKKIYMRWVHKNEKSYTSGTSAVGAQKFVAIQEFKDLPKTAKIHWYKHHIAEGIHDPLAGTFWEELPEYEDQFEIIFDPDITEKDQKLKVIIEDPYIDDQLEQLNNKLVSGYTMEFFYNLYEQYKDDEVLLVMALKNLHISLSINDVKAIVEEYLETYTYIASSHILYQSEVLLFENEQQVPDKATSDLIRSLKLEIDKIGYKGVYRIYKDNNEIMSSSESTRRRKITATYTSVLTGDEELDTAEAITWIIPTVNTMIYPPEDGVEYDSQNDKVEEKDGYIYITRYGVVSTKMTDENNEEADSAEQYFRIKDYYTQAYANNNIICRITKNNITYEAVAELAFGPCGTNGTDYTLTLEYESKTPAVDLNSEIVVIPRVYDYEDNDITETFTGDQFKYSWYSANPQDGIQLTQDGRNAVLKVCDDINKCHFYILQVTLRNVSILAGEEITKRTVTLKQILPIAVRSSNEYMAFDGASKIAYNASGVSPDYYKNPYALYRYNINKTEKISDVRWFMSFGPDTTGNSQLGKKYYPQISEEGKLTVPSMYLRDNGKQVAVIANLGGYVVWTQPLYIYQYVYDSALINAWDGNLTIDEENGTILSAMIGAGKKDSENRFNGVLMGDISRANDIMSDVGLYGYNEGSQSFGFKIDGTAFIGKRGKGQILIDGNSGRIQSLSYQENQTGMLIDLDDGFIDIRGARSNGGANTNDSNPLYTSTQSRIRIQTLDPYLTVDTENGIEILRIGTSQYYLKSENYNGKVGTRFDIADGHLVFYDQDGTGGYVRLRGDDSGFFSIYSGTTMLMYISNGSYFLQSNNYNASKSGIYMDLAQGIFMTSNSGAGVYISGSGSPFLNITSHKGTSLFYAGDGNYFIQSDDYATGEKGIYFDLNNGRLYANSFSIFAKGPGGMLTITSDGQYPISIVGNGGGYCNLGWNGSIMTPFFNVTDDGSIYGGNPQSDAGIFYIMASGQGKICGWFFNSQHASPGGGPKNTLSSANGSIVLDGYNGQIYAQGQKLFALDGAKKTGTIAGWKFTEKALMSSDEKSVILDSDGDVTINSNNGGYFKMGRSTDHPEVSGLNVTSTAGIKLYLHSGIAWGVYAEGTGKGIHEGELRGDWECTASLTIDAGLTVKNGITLEGGNLLLGSGRWSTNTFEWGPNAETAVNDLTKGKYATTEYVDGKYATKAYVDSEIAKVKRG